MKNLSPKQWGLFVCVLLTLLLSYSSSTVVFANQQPPNRSRADAQAEIKQTETPAPFEENSSGQFPAPNGIADVNTQGPAATEGSNPYRYLGTLVPSGTLANAYGIARDRNGRIFVTNGAKNKIGIFDAQTFQSLGLLQSAPAPKLNLPYGIGSDSDNNLYVADFNNNAVKKFTFDSATNSYTRTQWKNFNHPTGIWVDTWGNAWSNRVYVADTANHQIRIFGLDGAPAAKSTLKKNFSFPYGVAVGPSGRIYVADSGNHVIKVFNSNLKLVKTWTGFNEPRQLAVDANENIYVADVLNSRIKILKSDGSVLATINKYPGGPKFKLPQGVAVTPDGNTMYIADSGNNRVSVWGKPATLSVTKILVPSNDPGKFNLKIDSTTHATDVGNGGTTGAIALNPGAHTVTETAGAGTALSNYTTTIGGDCAGDGTITLNAGDTKTCTITNTRKATLTVTKILSPTTDTGKFNLRIDGTTYATDVGNGGTTGAITVNPGAHTISESAGTGTALTNYTTIIGGDCASNGAITLSAGDNKTCTITNTRKGYTMFGDGSDGELVVGPGVVSTPSPSTALSQSYSTGTVLNVVSTSGFTNCPEVMVHQTRGSGAGTYKFANVASIGSGTITLQSSLPNAFVQDSTSRTQVVCVRHFTDITVQNGGVLTANAWDGNSGGIIAFRANGLVTIQTGGALSASCLGYRGGGGRTADDGFQGESMNSAGSISRSPNESGGGGGLSGYDDGGGGGGGGNGSDGQNGQSGSGGMNGGGYGFRGLAPTLPEDLTSLVFGGGGGAGGGKQGGGAMAGGAGSVGGGIIIIAAKTMTLTDRFVSSGCDGLKDSSGFGGAGGGGSGGSILLRGQVFSLGTELVLALGGNGAVLSRSGSGGNGSVGRIRIEYCTSVSGTTNPPVTPVQITCQ